MTEVVTIYVRKGVADAERAITFKRPERLPQALLFDAGYAIDGNAWRLDVRGDASGRTLTQALREAERKLMDILSQHGYTAEFA